MDALLESGDVRSPPESPVESRVQAVSPVPTRNDNFGNFVVGVPLKNKFTQPEYKLRPIYPVHSNDLVFEHNNFPQLHTSCLECFPLQSVPPIGNYVNLLDFSQFNGLPYPMPRGYPPPSRWLADLRYTFWTPLPHTYPRVGIEVLKSKRVETAIQSEVTKNPSKSPYSLQKKAAQFYNEIRSSLSRFVCKVCAYVLYKVFRRLMRKLLVNPDQLAMVREAEQTGIPLVYLPLHRSHLDYLLITWCNWHFGLRLPHIASGDNLNLSGFGWLLRATGAFFIRRRIDPSDEGGKDALYRAVLHSYIEQLLKKDLPIEFFLEGTRNRFGKALVPKHGLISNVVEAVQQGIIKDCYLVPVSYTYDRVAEGVFLNELMGIPKVRESFYGVLREVWKGFRTPQLCGTVRMHYGRPIRLTEYLGSLKLALTRKRKLSIAPLNRMPHSYSYRELVPWHEDHEQEVTNRVLIRSIGYHIVFEAQSMMTISPTSILAALLLSKYRNGIDRNSLELDIEWLCGRTLEQGRDVLGWAPGCTCAEHLLNYALEYVRNSVVIDSNGQIAPSLTHRQLINLAYCRNALVPVFALKAAIALSLRCRALDCAHPLKYVMEDVLSICDWMQYEVIFCRPCCDLRSTITKQLCGGLPGSGDVHSPLVNVIYGDDVTSNIEDAMLQIPSGSAPEILAFYADFLRPFLQSLYIVVHNLQSYAEAVREQVFIRQLCKQALASAKEMPFEILLEAINSDSLKNSIRILRQKSFLTSDEILVELAPNAVVGLKEVETNLLRVLGVKSRE